jgi:hypothetical protein
MRGISALLTPYDYELGIDLREKLDIVDVGDVFVIPGNLAKSFDQITRGIEHIRVAAGQSLAGSRHARHRSSCVASPPPASSVTRASRCHRPYDHSDITSLLGVRLARDALAAMVAAGKLGRDRGGRRQSDRAREVDARV